MSLKVLTVDDSKTIRMIVKKAFKSYDCIMCEAENGMEGLEMARQENPDLIVLDITMPVMNGIEMLGKLKEDPDLKGIPVIMLTAESGKDNVMQIVKMGVTDYIVKPFKGEQLIGRAEQIVTLSPKEAKESTVEPAAKYFKMDGDIHCLTLPQKIDRQVAAEIDTFLQKQLTDIVKNGTGRFVVDLRKVMEINVALVKLTLLVIKNCQKSEIRYRVVGTPEIKTEFKGFQETCNIEIDQAFDEAKSALA
jgi:CheY-like chemotaxis protein